MMWQVEQSDHGLLTGWNLARVRPCLPAAYTCDDHLMYRHADLRPHLACFLQLSRLALNANALPPDLVGPRRHGNEAEQNHTAQSMQLPGKVQRPDPRLSFGSDLRLVLSVPLRPRIIHLRLRLSLACCHWKQHDRE
jgi:hypothetical protein